jgi:flagellar basal body rod protein FlgG
MNIGLYLGAATMGAMDRWQDSIAQNIASSANPGFRKRVVEFSTEPAGTIATAQSAAGVAMPAMFPVSRPGYSFVNGEMTSTGRDLDIAIQGEGFFEVQGEDGQRLYTRAGNFHLDADRTIVDVMGRTLLGDGGAPIQLLSTGGTIAIAKDGTLTQGEQPLGKLAVYRFEDPQSLQGVSGSAFTANGQAPQQVEHPTLIQRSLEGSNVWAVQEMVSLVRASRAYEAAQKIVTSRDDTLDKTIRAVS